MSTDVVRIPCSRCDHESPSDLAAFEHWRDTHKRGEHDDLGPGLHQVGPAPYDYVFNPAKGQRITCVSPTGRTVTGTVTNVEEDKESGEVRLTVQQLDDPPAGPWLGDWRNEP